jgi:hypothetical protein
MQLELRGSAADTVSASADLPPSFFQRLFDASGFMPRWQCGDWSSELGWLHIISDFLIFVAYACIPLSLMFFVFRRRDIALKGVVWLFVAFILSCGLTHLLDASMFYHPAYRLLGMMKGITAIVSLATVVAIFRVMPTAISLPGIAEAHKIAQKEIERCRRVETELVRTRDELETRSALLTGRLHRAKNALISIDLGLVSWNVEDNKILWESGLNELFDAAGRAVHSVETWEGVLGETEASELRDAARRAIASQSELLFSLPHTVSGDVKRVLEIRAKPDHGEHEQKTMTGSVAWRLVKA